MRTEHKIKYYHLLRRFVPNDILGHIFDEILFSFINLSKIGVCPDLLQIAFEPIILTYSPNDQELDDEILEEMNSVGRIGIKLI